MHLHENEVGYVRGRKVARMRRQYSHRLDECVQAMLLQHEVVSLLQHYLLDLGLGNAPMARVRSHSSISQIPDLLILFQSLLSLDGLFVFLVVNVSFLVVFQGCLLLLCSTIEQ